MITDTLSLLLSQSAASKLRELQVRCDREHKAIGITYIEESRQSRRYGELSHNVGWEITLFDMDSVATLPGWYTVEDLTVFVPSNHLLYLLKGKTLDYMEGEFVIVDSSGSTSTS